MLQTAVEMVKPGGTGSPALVISARPAPLPPSRSFIVRLPSAFPAPKKYTCLFDLPAFAAFFTFVFAIITPVKAIWSSGNRVIWSLIEGLKDCLPSRLFRFLWSDLRDVGNPENRPPQGGQEGEPRLAHHRILGHHEHVDEEAVDRGPERAELPHRLRILLLNDRRLDQRKSGVDLLQQRRLGRLHERATARRGQLAVEFPGDVLDPLEEDRQRLEVGRLPRLG